MFNRAIQIIFYYVLFLNWREASYFILFLGGLCKDSSGSGIKKLLSAGILTLDRILVQSDSPFMYPNARAANLSEAAKSSLTQRYFIISDKKLVNLVNCNFNYQKIDFQ